MTHFIIETRPVKHGKNLLTPLHSAASAAAAGEAGEVSSQQRCRCELVRLSLRGPEVPHWPPKEKQRTGKMASSWDCILRRKGRVRLG